MKDEALLLDMLIAARRAIEFTRASTFSSFRTDDLVQNAVVRVLQVLGEASRHLSLEFKQGHPDIPWAKILGLRNRLVHEYMAIDYEIVWEVVQRDLPSLIQQIEPLVPRDDQI
jgi:uncharacterized protein with HEPN domain